MPGGHLYEMTLFGHVQGAKENSLRWLVVATLPHGQIVKVCTGSGKRGERKV